MQPYSDPLWLSLVRQSDVTANGGTIWWRAALLMPLNYAHTAYALAIFTTHGATHVNVLAAGSPVQAYIRKAATAGPAATDRATLIVRRTGPRSITAHVIGAVA